MGDSGKYDVPIWQRGAQCYEAQLAAKARELETAQKRAEELEAIKTAAKWYIEARESEPSGIGKQYDNQVKVQAYNGLKTRVLGLVEEVKGG